MATIKSYSDLQQSKVLAEILPLESADMHYLYDYNFEELESIPTITEEDDHFALFPKDVRCWSLAALLGILPVTATLLKDENISNIGDVKYNCECSMVNTHCWFDNPVDACYEMIIRLHELNLL